MSHLAADDSSRCDPSGSILNDDLALQDEPAHPSRHFPRNVLDQIFNSLGPNDLAVCAGVCSSWRSAALSAPWDSYYHARWPLDPSLTLPSLLTMTTQKRDWKCAFSSRMALARSLWGRPSLDRLSSHASGVKVTRILPQYNSLLSGSVDRRLILWDLENGVQSAASALHAGTVRCLALDDGLLATGCSDHRIRVWTPNKNNIEEEEFPFRIDGPRAVLSGGHSGPVSALEMCPTALFSGSWDYCVRVWDRTGGAEQHGSSPDEEESTQREFPLIECIQVLHFDDWVMGMALKAGRLLVAAGHEAHVVDAGAGGGLKPLFSVRRRGTTAAVTAVQGTEDGKYLFYSTSEGGIHACDLRVSWQQQSRDHQGFCCSSAVTGLAWDYPWLAASLQNGEVFLLDAESILAGYSNNNDNRYSMCTPRASTPGSKGSRRAPSAGWQSPRVLAGGVPGGAQCVDIHGRWVVTGYECGTVATWDFSKAEEAARAAHALRAGRRRAREQRRAETASVRGQRKGRNAQRHWVISLDEYSRSEGQSALSSDSTGLSVGEIDSHTTPGPTEFPLPPGNQLDFSALEGTGRGAVRVPAPITLAGELTHVRLDRWQVLRHGGGQPRFVVDSSSTPDSVVGGEADNEAMFSE